MKKIIFIISFFLFMPITFATETVETVPNSDISVVLDLFDYDIEDTRHNHPDNIINTKFNLFTPLKFYGVGENEYEGSFANPNPDRFTESDAVRQGMVEPTLNNEGFPVLTNDTHDDLNIIFDYTANDFKHIYPSIKSFFVKKSTGFYYFSSDEFYAEYDNENNDMKLITPTFKLKNSLQSVENEILYTGFFPFDTYNPEKNDVSPAMELPTSIGYNHQFGMHIKSKIYLPEDLKIEGKDMEFTFSGDDDIWIFLDGVLVLDLGGIHHPATGSINLTTGIAYTEKIYDGTEEGHPLTISIDEIFTSVNKQFNRTKNSEHQFDIFYLERGGVFSNLKIETNFWQPQPEPEEPTTPVEEPLNTEEDVNSSQNENPKTSNDNLIIPIVIISTIVFLIAFYIADNGLIIRKNMK